MHIDNNVGNEWHYLASSYSGLTPRAAHSAVYVRETDSLYVYGGFDLNNILGGLQVNTMIILNRKMNNKKDKSFIDIPVQQKYMGR